MDLQKEISDAVRLGLDALPALARALTRELPIREIENYESVLKALLRDLFSKGVSGEDARRIAQFQKNIGFTRKYKSYAVKAASPLGYSIFFQRPGEGFSFQRHVTHKTEVFHILNPLPGGYVFLCSHDDWAAVYEPESFEHWMNGAADARYERFRIYPRPGDVFVIDRLNVVHTVIGCVLEEFATVSTDMVDRLHDQNEGCGVPPEFSREFVEKQLFKIEAPASRRVIDIATQAAAALEPEPRPGGRVTRLACNDMRIAWHEIDPGAETQSQTDISSAASLYVTSGSGRLALGEPAELQTPDPPAISIGAGDLLIVPPGIAYALINGAGEKLMVSEHRLPYKIALI